MPVNVAIVGPVGSGKTTLFSALAGRGSDGMGMVDVPDGRLGRLADAVQPKRIVAAQLRLTDAPPGSRAQRIAAAREADAVIKVVRGFGPDPDPAGDLEGLELDADSMAVLQPLFLVSAKPSVVIANVGEERLPDGGDLAERVRALAVERGWTALVVDAQLEAELAELEPDDAAAMRETYGLSGSSLDAVARAVWDAGGLITFFTAGEPEVRAWPCERESPAPVAAGVIHSDFEKN